MLESAYTVAHLWEQHLDDYITTKRRPELYPIRAHTGFVDYLHRVAPYLQNIHDETPRFIPSPSSFGTRWDHAGARIMPLIEAGHLALPLQYNPEFGNPFVYVMEYYCRLITSCIDNILFANSMLDEVKFALAHLDATDRNYVRTYNDTVTLLEKASASIRSQERELASWLRGLRSWARRHDLSDESEAFFSDYTECYYGQSFLLDGLYWWFEVDERL